MGLKCGIVGLPNVGKSTLFNALTQSQKAQAENYPFCTIEPNSATVAVPDKRLYELAKLAGSQKIIPSYIEFVDIAGLVEGASKGEGLGNKFLAHIREVDAIVHVVRCFEDKDIAHVRGKVDPVDDIEIIETELVLADLESVEKRIANLQKKAKANDKAAKETIALLESVYPLLKDGRPIRAIVTKENQDEINSLQLLTSKPILYVCNVNEEEAISGNEFTKRVANLAEQQKTQAIIISAKIESEIALINNLDEKAEFLQVLGLAESGVDKIIRSCYQILDLSSYFTIGPKEAHSWTFKKGIKAPQAAGIIHSDFERGFICAEVISTEDYLKYGSESKIKELGKMRLEGREYKVDDGDIINFRFNV
jgi:GTP-binding protein YchF